MNQLGYYGKTPHRGDFLRFNLPLSFIKVWDDWLQQVMINGETHIPDWSTVYPQAPSYRFALSKGIAGSNPWIGIFKASKDKVGRRFPFCLAMALPEHALPCMSMTTQASWFMQADALLARVFTSEYNFDDLQVELATMAEQHSLTESTVSSLVSHTCDPVADSVTISMTSSSALQNVDTLPAVLDSVLQQTLSEYSLWIATSGSEATVVNAGLPTDKAGLALFDKQWESASTTHLDIHKLLPFMQNDAAHAAVALVSSDDASSGALIKSVESAPDNKPVEENEPLSDFAASSDSTEPAIDEHDTTHPESTEQVPTADDWAALDVFVEPAAEPVIKPTLPEIEPLELDEDDSADAPWER